MGFVFARSLERHLIHGTDISGPAYKCQLCSEQCQSMTALQSHVSAVHSVTGPKSKYQCPDCNRLFSNESHLKYHMMTHTGRRTPTATGEFKTCSVCGKHFPTKCQLQLHERIHSGAKSFVCSLCGQAFRQQSHLSRHCRTHTTACQASLLHVLLQDVQTST